MNDQTAKLFADLKTWCTTHKVKYAELSRLLGVSRQLITEWFHDRSKPTGPMVLQIQALIKRKPKERKKKPGVDAQKILKEMEFLE